MRPRTSRSPQRPRGTLTGTRAASGAERPCGPRRWRGTAAKAYAAPPPPPNKNDTRGMQPHAAYPPLERPRSRRNPAGMTRRPERDEGACCD
ncbi:hypothetical protein NDU88_008053 [Pleurodeles waltl]|uniref:Uncharacterized protein n=1 Tax=Pleurodeles waltl TaxID=8319 RepID=A0AAV7ND54_PLEWA|nr:hypothetical protein NDU88_008053 [Pleurodeles waltl]